jgi:hypothetical protein
MARSCSASSQLEGRGRARIAASTQSSGTSSRRSSAARAIDAAQPSGCRERSITSETGVSSSASAATAWSNNGSSTSASGVIMNQAPSTSRASAFAWATATASSPSKSKSGNSSAERRLNRRSPALPASWMSPIAARRPRRASTPTTTNATAVTASTRRTVAPPPSVVKPMAQIPATASAGGVRANLTECRPAVRARPCGRACAPRAR